MINIEKLYPIVKNHSWFKEMGVNLEYDLDHEWLVVNTGTHGRIYVDPTGEISWDNLSFDFPTIEQLTHVTNLMQQIKNLIKLNWRSVKVCGES